MDLIWLHSAHLSSCNSSDSSSKSGLLLRVQVPHHKFFTNAFVVPLVLSQRHRARTAQLLVCLMTLKSRF